jgi:hypothetical protein
LLKNGIGIADVLSNKSREVKQRILS